MGKAFAAIMAILFGVGMVLPANEQKQPGYVVAYDTIQKLFASMRSKTQPQTESKAEPAPAEVVKADDPMAWKVEVPPEKIKALREAALKEINRVAEVDLKKEFFEDNTDPLYSKWFKKYASEERIKNWFKRSPKLETLAQEWAEKTARYITEHGWPYGMTQWEFLEKVVREFGARSQVDVFREMDQCVMFRRQSASERVEEIVKGIFVADEAHYDRVGIGVAAVRRVGEPAAYVFFYIYGGPEELYMGVSRDGWEAACGYLVDWLRQERNSPVHGPTSLSVSLCAEAYKRAEAIRKIMNTNPDWKLSHDIPGLGKPPVGECLDYTGGGQTLVGCLRTVGSALAHFKKSPPHYTILLSHGAIRVGLGMASRPGTTAVVSILVDKYIPADW